MKVFVVHAQDRHHVRWNLVDNPSPSLLRLLRVEFPNLTGVAMDTAHLAMKCESTLHGEKHSLLKIAAPSCWKVL